jgi:hypothetical protein
VETVVTMLDPLGLAAPPLFDNDGIFREPQLTEMSGDMSTKVIGTLKLLPADVASSGRRTDVNRQGVPVAVIVQTFLAPMMALGAPHGLV